MKVDVRDYTSQYTFRMKSLRIDHMREQLMDIASSKSWKLITYYRQILAIWCSERQNLFQKLSDMYQITGRFLGVNREDIFDPTSRVSKISSANQQIKLFNHIINRNGEVAVILHLYYIDLWEEIADYLDNIPKPFDLFVSVPEKKERVIPLILSAYPKVHIYICPNRGRDVAPFLEIYSAVAPLGYHVICKIHTKKSPHKTTGENWRRGMLDELLGSQQRVKDILELFDHYSEIGMVAPDRYLYSAIDISTMTNLYNMQCLSDVMGVSLNDLEFEYPAGSMFWFRPESFSPLAESGIQTKDFPPEHGQLNNTLAHALERFFGLFIQQAHQYIVETSVLHSSYPVDK